MLPPARPIVVNPASLTEQTPAPESSIPTTEFLSENGIPRPTYCIK